MTDEKKFWFLFPVTFFLTFCGGMYFAHRGDQFWSSLSYWANGIAVGFGLIVFVVSRGRK